MSNLTSSFSAFDALGFTPTLDHLHAEVQELYLADPFPWIIGYSGGKDSTAILQHIWLALEKLSPEQRHKTVHVVSTDTLVENPIVSAWVERSHEVMRRTAVARAIPIEPHRLTPEATNSFWTNLIGRGYPAPRHKFRWCTERLKIKPSNQFILDLTRQSGQAILVLGARKAESQARARSMTRLEKGRVRDRLSPNASLPGCLVYTPIEDWTNDDVWRYLMQVKNPWGYQNKDLLTMYQGASADGECPLVVDTSTPSCGDSRFGCWVCTLVEKDKSMTAMIQNDVEKEWMLPLLEIRNALDFRLMGDKEDPESHASDRHLRDYRRMNGSVQFMGEGENRRVIPGPYTQEARAEWLRKVLRAQTYIRHHGPAEMRSLELITLAELEEIRRLWVFEKREIEDLLPELYSECVGVPYPGRPIDTGKTFQPADLRLLRELCQQHGTAYELVRDLLDVGERTRHQRQRKPVLRTLETVLKRHLYSTEEEALAADREDQTRLQQLRPADR